MTSFNSSEVPALFRYYFNKFFATQNYNKIAIYFRPVFILSLIWILSLQMICIVSKTF
jgi:hypothetical protein